MIADCRAASRRDRKRTKRLRAWLNGTDVTKECYFADTRKGIVRVYLRDSEGFFYFVPEKRDVARAELRGVVRLTRR